MGIFLWLPLSIFGDSSGAHVVSGTIHIAQSKVAVFSTVEPVIGRPLQLKVAKFDDWTNGFNNQIVMPYRLIVIPSPSHQQEVKDENGDLWYELNYTHAPAKIIIESIFDYESYSNYSSLDSVHPYPMILPQHTDWSPFLDIKWLSHDSIILIRQELKPLLKAKTRSIDVLVNIVSKLSRLVRVQPQCLDVPIDRILRKRCGTHRSFLELVLAFLRVSGFPTRISVGIGLDNPIVVHDDHTKFSFELRYPKGEYFWLESYIPDRDWVPLDPLSSVGVLPPTLIRAATSSSRILRIVDIGNKEQLSSNVFHRVFFDERPKNLSLNLENYHKISGKSLFIVPYGSLFDESFGRSSNRVDDVYSFVDMNDAEVIDLSVSSSFHLDVASPDPYIYAQSFFIDRSMNLDYIEVPLYNYKFPLKGEIWAEVVDEKNGGPGSLVIRSQPISRMDLPTKENAYTWISFPFTDSKHTLLKGNYWIVLRASAHVHFLWYGIFANPLGKLFDTMQLKHGSASWGRKNYFDLVFNLVGDKY